MKRVMERLYGCSGVLNDTGQYAYYGRVAGCVITGNEDDVKHCAMNVLYSLQHLGFTNQPQADAGWIGPAVPRCAVGGPENDFSKRNTTFMTYDLMHLAALLRAATACRRTATEAASGTPAAHPSRTTPNTARHLPRRRTQ